ncbi:MAG TPA: PQQ-binding-like beta-propeller repeat protein, partial [Isosphaeraceae bacterium]|nr:PQQ-binding-like beta-propeller repeat protein [Isosphaeraceae bacterium]
MATLEIHDAKGRVQLVPLAQDHPVLFGTSPSCDVVLEGAGIKPVHGRIRWKSQRYKVEASPDAGFVVVNGHQMTTGSVHQGDWIAVGPCRMYLRQVEEESVGTRRQRPSPDEGPTQVRAPSSVPVPSRTESRRDERRAQARSRSEVQPPDRPVLKRTPWIKEARPDEGTDQAGWQAQTRDLAVGPRQDGIAAMLRRWIPQAHGAPGREQIASSPLVIGLVVALAILIAMGFWLKSIIAATVASRTYNHAVEDFEAGDYRTAIRDFDAFLAVVSPEDPRAGKARVRRALANVRQYIAPNGSTWTTALEAAREMVDRVGREEAFRDERADLAELVIRIGEGLADRARQTADPKALAEAESAVPLHARIAGESASSFLNRSPLPTKLAEARAAVRKAEVRARALATMDRALEQGSPSKVYQARDDLLDQYADLAHDRQLVTRMTSANELIRKAVTIDTTRRAAARGARPDPLGPATSLVIRSGPGGTSGTPAPAPAPESIVLALADGFAFAIDATAGEPLWQTPLGLASPYVPQPVPGDPTVLAFDARSNELVRLDARNGALIWRLELGERVVDPPLVLGNQLAQVLPSGKLLIIALEAGELQATVNLGRPLARMPAHDESGRHLYLVGRQDCLFILTRDPLACSAVEYLGHQDGSVPCAPARLGRFLVIPENDSLTESRWQVLVLDEDGGRVRPTQELKVAGWTWQTPAAAGSIVWAAGDKAGFEAFAVGDPAAKAPFRSIARLIADSTPSGPAFTLARSDRELWAASGHPGKFALDLERGKIESKVSLPSPGPALAPIQVAGKLLVATFLDRESGGVALWGFDPESGTVAWKTVVGAPWPSPLSAAANSTGWATIGRDGRDILISSQQLARGGFVVMPLPRPGEFRLPAGQRLRVDRDGRPLTVVVPQPSSNTPRVQDASKPDGWRERETALPTAVVVRQPHANTIWVQDASKPGGWRETALPAATASEPMAWGDAVLVPGADGRVYLIDPVTGRSRAEPYVPQFDRDHQGNWWAPARLDQDTIVLADEVGRVRRVGLKLTPVPRLTAEAEALLDRPIISDPASTGGAVLVATADRRVRSLAARDLSPVGAWPLEAPLSGRPVGLGDGGLVSDRTGTVLAFGRDGQRIWSIKLGAEVVGAPRVLGRSILFLTADGLLHVRARSDGSAIDSRPLGILPAGGPLTAGPGALIPVGAG